MVAAQTTAVTAEVAAVAATVAVVVVVGAAHRGWTVVWW